MAKNNDSYINGAKDGELMRLLEQTPLSFEKRAIAEESPVSD